MSFWQDDEDYPMVNLLGNYIGIKKEFIDMIYSKQSADAVLERYFDAFVKKSSTVIIDTVETMGLGAERTFMTVAPELVPELTMFPQYNRVIKSHLSANRDLILVENKRMVMAIMMLSRDPLTISEMIKVTIHTIFISMPAELQDRVIEKLPSLIAPKGSSLVANTATKMATKIALTEAIIRIVSYTISSDPDVLKQAGRITTITLTAFQIYAIVEKASRSARKLRRENTAIYNQLYQMKIEMLYFLIEKKVDTLINAVKEKSADDVIQALSEILQQ
ncbi:MULTISPECIES: hypothetical protein [unclassified Serratia (in: enterobacteria)]|nr:MULTISPECIES: hypothetical protein [unclassified Serratia (in: enterobacteria)]UAN54453.1 hypothetical protein KGP26_02460 [Serratia sp. JSRIV002]UAN65748.1 hypothetical protein KGP16_02450 [Serratia sp. JSRIV006]